jgi:quercetin dioxygenase-like cupin family protein
MDERAQVVQAPTHGPIPDAPRIAAATVLSTPDVRVVEIAFGAGAELSEHSAPAPIIVQVLDGSVDFEVAGAVHTIEAPGFIHLPNAGERHRVTAAWPARIQITMLLTGVQSSHPRRAE